MTWLDDLAGLRTLQDDGSVVTSRQKINAVGGISARDNASGERTDLVMLTTTVVALGTTVGAYDGQHARCVCHTARGDNGGGDFFWDEDSVATADNGITVAVSGVATGRWIRDTSGTISMAWFGAITAAKINAALTIQNALGGGTVTIPKSAMTITGIGTDSILPLSNTKLVLDPGCTITTGVPTGIGGYVIFIGTNTTDKENITIEGNGCIVTGDRSVDIPLFGCYINTQTIGDVCKDIHVSGFTFKNFRYDGITLGGNAGCYAERVRFSRILTDNCRRNGGAITGGVRGFLADDCEFNGTNGSAVQSGFDIEVDTYSGGFLQSTDIKFVNCKANDNAGLGFYCQSAATTVTTRVLLLDCEAVGNDGIGISASIPNMVVDNCNARRNGSTGINLANGAYATNCHAQDNVAGFAIHTGSSANNCTARWNSGSGFTVDSSARTTTPSVLTACTSYANRGKGYDLSSAKNTRLIGCDAYANRADGVRIGSSHHCQIVGGLYAGNGQISEAGGDNIIVEANSTLNNIGGGVQLRMSQSFFRGVAVVDATYTTTTRTKLHASASLNDDDYIGMFVRVISGTNSGAYGMITDYDGTNQYITTYWDDGAYPLTGTAPGVLGTAGALGAACDGTSVMEIVGGRAFSGTCESATASTFTLQDEIGSWTDDVFVNYLVTIVSGAGSAAVNRTRRITDYVGSTQTGTVSDDWDTTPDHTSVIEIIGVMRPRYGLRIDATCANNRYQDVDAYYAGTTGQISDGGSSSTTANRTT